MAVYWGVFAPTMGEGTLPPQRNAHFGSSRRRGGSVADPPGCLLGTLEAHLGARDPLEGGDPSGGWGTPQGGGKAAAVTKLDVKARETQVAVVPPRPSPPPPCQSLTRASSWTACAWQGRHMRAWARARAWSGKARASWARSYRTVGSRSSMRATGGAFSANLPPPPLRVRCPRARHTGWRPHLEQAAKTTALRRSSGQSARCLSPS